MPTASESISGSSSVRGRCSSSAKKGVSNSKGSVTSSNATLTVVSTTDTTAPTVTVTESGTSGTITLGATATDNVAVTGWQFANGTQTTTDGYYPINNNGQISITATKAIRPATAWKCPATEYKINKTLTSR